MKHKSLSVILLNWNTKELTAACITSLLLHCDAQSFDIIVADNGSTDHSLEYLRQKFPHLTYLDNKENLGFAEGNNRALAYAMEQGYAYSLLLNTDTYLEHDIIKPLLAYKQKHPEAGAVQPAILTATPPHAFWNGGGRYSVTWGRTHSNTRNPQKGAGKIDWATGCCVLLDHRALQKTGLFNSAYFLYYEDVELSFRLKSKGYEIHYLPDCVLYHHAGASGKKSNQKEGKIRPVIHYYTSRNKIWLIRQYTPVFYRPTVFLYNFGYFAAALSYFLLRGRTQKAKSLLKGIKEGLVTPLGTFRIPTNNMLKRP